MSDTHDDSPYSKAKCHATTSSAVLSCLRCTLVIACIRPSWQSSIDPASMSGSHANMRLVDSCS